MLSTSQAALIERGLLPDVTQACRDGVVELLTALLHSFREAHKSSDTALRDHVAYLGWLTYERMIPILGFTVPGNLLLLSAQHATRGSFLWSIRNTDEALTVLRTNRPTWLIDKEQTADD